VPTYSYACTECGHEFDIQQSFSDSSLNQCPVCEGRLRKIYSAVGVVFKGSGFYRNDSRSAPGGTKSESASAGDGVKAGVGASSEGGSKGEAASGAGDTKGTSSAGKDGGSGGSGG